MQSPFPLIEQNNLTTRVVPPSNRAMRTASAWPPGDTLAPKGTYTLYLIRKVCRTACDARAAVCARQCVKPTVSLNGLRESVT